jgi:uncharacterized membrane protein/protein-disulfide isomerase
MEKLKRQSWTIALLAALGAIGLHFYLTSKFFALRFGALTSESVCNLNELWNCDTVSASQYAQFLGIPMALWGLTTNLIFALMLIGTRLRWFENDDRGKRYVYWYALIIGLASVVMGFISLTKLKSLCLFCVIAYGLSIVAFIATRIWARPHFFEHLGDDVRALFAKHHVTLGSFIAVPALAFLMNSMFLDQYNGNQIGLIAQEKVLQWKQAPMQVFDTTQGLSLYKGTGNPQMEIVEFADFRCPHCKTAVYSLDSFASAHNDVRLIYKYFPLDGSCNEAIGGGKGGDGISCAAAFITQCSEKLFKRGWDAHHFFYNNQSQLHGISNTEEVLKMACDGLKYDCAAVKACVENPETVNEVRAMAAEGARAKISGTPTIFVNGRQLSGGQLIPVLEEAHADLLKTK